MEVLKKPQILSFVKMVSVIILTAIYDNALHKYTCIFLVIKLK